ncbi:MAG: hypothetical protein HYV07_13560 [Deltaproteobacteria bacterium]|nr:hypothetical protein [Deltaproteobacteria bacterium]
MSWLPEESRPHLALVLALTSSSCEQAELVRLASPWPADHSAVIWSSSGDRSFGPVLIPPGGGAPFQVSLDRDHDIFAATFAPGRADGFAPGNCRLSLADHGEFLPAPDERWVARAHSLAFEPVMELPAVIAVECPNPCDEVESLTLIEVPRLLRGAIVAPDERVVLIARTGELWRLAGDEVEALPALEGLGESVEVQGVVYDERTIHGLLVSGRRFELELDGSARLVASLPGSVIDASSIGPDGTLLTIGQVEGQARIFELARGSTVAQVLEPPPGASAQIAQSLGSGRFLLGDRGCPAGSSCGRWRVWLFERGSYVVELEGPRGSIQGFASDGVRVLLTVHGGPSYLREADGKWGPRSLTVSHGLPHPLGGGRFLVAGDYGAFGLVGPGRTCSGLTDLTGNFNSGGSASADGRRAYLPVRTDGPSREAVARFPIPPRF